MKGIYKGKWWKGSEDFCFEGILFREGELLGKFGLKGKGWEGEGCGGLGEEGL